MFVTVRNPDLLEIIIGIHAAIRDSIRHCECARMRASGESGARGTRSAVPRIAPVLVAGEPRLPRGAAQGIPE